jgi:hypothetical protein
MIQNETGLCVSIISHAHPPVVLTGVREWGAKTLCSLFVFASFDVLNAFFGFAFDSMLFLSNYNKCCWRVAPLPFPSNLHPVFAT